MPRPWRIARAATSRRSHDAAYATHRPTGAPSGPLPVFSPYAADAVNKSKVCFPLRSTAGTMPPAL